MSYEPPILSRNLGFVDAKAPESNTKSQPRLSQGEKPVNGITRSLPQQDDIQRQDFKLLIDPAIKKGHAKIYRYNGVFPGQPPVTPKDPRSRRTRIWTLNKADLPVPNFKVDKWYVGIPPQREVHFSGLNDNVDKKFLEEMCERYGRIDAIKIYYDPQTKKHTGKARVTYGTSAAAKMAVSKLDHTSVMGNIIKAHIDANTKGHEVHGKPRGPEHHSIRRNSGHDSSSVMLHTSSYLPTPSPSIISQSSSTDSSVLSPSVLLRKSPASSVSLPTDIRGTSFSSSWDKTTGSAINKLSQSGSAFMSPQSVSSGQSTFEPVSPPHSFWKKDEPPPPPPPSSKPPPLPVAKEPLPPVTKEPPPPPPKDIPAQSTSCIKYEDISPDPVFSPGDEEKLTATQKRKDAVNTKAKSIDPRGRSSGHSASPPRKAHSPRIDRSESYTKWERKKQVEREEKYREKYRDSDRGNDRDRGYKDDQRVDRHGDYRHKRDGYYDKRDNYRQSDYDRNRTSSRWDKDDSKYRKDRYSTSPRRGDDYRWSDVKESRNRDPRIRDKDGETGSGREMHSKDERNKEEQSAEDGYSRDPRLKGRNQETSDTQKRTNKVKEQQDEGERSETKDVVNKDPRVKEKENLNSVTVIDNDLSNLKLQDPRLQRKGSEQKGIYHSHSSDLGYKDITEQPKENHEAKDEDHECVSNSVETENDTNLPKAVSAEEIISSVVAGTSLGETAVRDKYSEDAYTVGVETCSDEEEPLPPGDEGDVAHEVQLDITRSKIKAAQNAVKKRKLSETTFQDEKKSSGAKTKKIQIVLKSVQLSSAETEVTSLVSVENLLKDVEPSGGWNTVSPDVAADVAVSTEVEDSSSRLVNLPLTEDISPCNSPAIETTSHMECSTSAASKEPASVDLYSDIEGNEDDNDGGDVKNDDNDDAMSLSSISSNEDTLEVNEPDSKLTEKPKGISVPPPNVVFPPYPPPMFNPSIPPPPFFNPRVPPPPIVPVTVPPPPIPAHPSVPPPPICPSLPARPILPPTVPPPAAPPIPVSLPTIPHSFSGPSGFYDPRAVPQFSGSGYPNSGGHGYQKQEQKKPWRAVIIDEVYRNICGELDTVLKRDIFKKLVEASAFKALESWWDNQSKPKTTSVATASTSKNLSMGSNPASTVGLSSNSGTEPSTIGPSPFERSHSMLLGLRASLPKLPSFKVKRPPELPKTEDHHLSRKRSNTESSDMLERDSKRQLVEGADLEMETDLESSSGWDKCPRTVSRLEEGERSQSPWQQLDESMDVAPRATIVRSTEADERRPSTGSSLYHKVYSSSSSSSGSGSDASESEEEDEESEEGSDDESESSESDEESESESEEEDIQSEVKQDAETLNAEMEIEHAIKPNQEVAQEVETEQDFVHESVTPASVMDSLTFNLNDDVETTNKEPERTVETKTVSQKTNCQVEQVAHMEPFHSFHIANIVPDLFKNHDDSADKTALYEDEGDSTENEMEIAEKSHESRFGLDGQILKQFSNKPKDIHSSSEGINTTIKLEESSEKTDIRSPVVALEFGFQDKENVQPSTIDFMPEKKTNDKIDEDDDVFADRPPLLSPDKPLAVSLIELDHSYGMAVSDEPEPILEPEEEPELFDKNSKKSPLPGDRVLTESPVVDIITVDSVVPRPPAPDLSPPKPQFPVRSFEADDQLVYEFHRLGIDAEDCYYMKVGFEQLQQVGSESVVDAHWSSHPPTAQPAPKSRRKQKTEHGVRVHVTGCARAEGFYKIDFKEKAKYLQAQRRQLQCQANITEKEQKTDGKAKQAKQQSRDHRAIQRRLQSAVCNEEFGDLLKFNQLRVRKKQLRFAKSGIHDWGLFAMESIAADEMVTEYVGEVIRQPIADIRERRYEDMGIGSSYLFRVDQDTIIDATTKGNLARFINHCCDPNCYAKIVTLENAKKIVIYSKRDIEVNEEITYDYKFPIEDEKIPCLCGVPQCRGTLN